LTGIWVPHDVGGQIVDFVRCWSEKTEIGAGRIMGWLGLKASKFFNWRKRCGKAYEHKARVPRDFCLDDQEKNAIVDFHLNRPLEVYRHLNFIMLHWDIVAVSPDSVGRTKRAGNKT
jgi:hypothetical protein